MFFFLGIFSCQQNGQQASLQDEEQQIRKLTQQWLKAESNKNLDSSLTFIAEDGVYLPNDWPTLHGHEEISKFLNAAFAMPLDTIVGGTEKIEVSASGDMAYEFGRTEIPFHFADRDTVFKTHYIVVWKKINGQWKAVATSVGSTR
ncbi:MAG: YybH family protein [bacterium]